MTRILSIGLTFLILAACGPADPTPPAEPAAPTPPAVSPAAAAAPVSASQPVLPMSWEAMQDHYRQIEVAPTDPLEALELRAVLCTHFMGETGSEDAEREAFLSAQMDKYRCGDVLVAEARAMRESHPHEPAVLARLNIILAELA